MQPSDSEKTHLTEVYGSFPAGRLIPYLIECDSNQLAALRLYDWNTKASGALYETLSHFEVIFRNRIDEALASRHQFKKRPGDWLDDAHGEFTRPASDAIAEAKARAREGYGSSTPPRGRTLAELNFGFWRRLLDARYEATHGSAVMRLFPTLKRENNANMENVRQLVEPLYSLRNRIAHLEPVWPLNLGARRDDAITILRSVNEQTAIWVAAQSRLDGLLTEKSTF